MNKGQISVEVRNIDSTDVCKETTNPLASSLQKKSHAKIDCIPNIFSTAIFLLDLNDKVMMRRNSSLASTNTI